MTEEAKEGRNAFLEKTKFLKKMVAIVKVLTMTANIDKHINSK
jgi:hypothetical protein